MADDTPIFSEDEIRMATTPPMVVSEEDVDELIERAFSGMHVKDIDGDDAALLARVLNPSTEVATLVSKGARLEAALGSAVGFLERFEDRKCERDCEGFGPETCGACIIHETLRRLRSHH